MIYQKSSRLFILAAICLSCVDTAQASLHDLNNGQLYDDVTGLVWLQNANLAATNTFGVSGINSFGYMNWNTANDWIAAMNAANYLGYNNWMLPTVSPVNGTSINYNSSADGSTDIGFNITSIASPLSYMYYVNLNLIGYYDTLWNVQSNYGVYGDGSTHGFGQVDIGLVRNLQSKAYWYGTVYGADPSTYAFQFRTSEGDQNINVQSSDYAMAAWAVRPANAIPEPSTATMALAGLGLLGFAARIARDAVVICRTACPNAPLRFASS